MKHRALAAAAFVLAAAVPAQQSTQKVIVIRHDPSLLRLHPSMLNALLGEERLRNAMDAVADFPDDDEAHAFVESIGEDFEQPPGVFAGTLTVTSARATKQQLESLTKVVSDLLRHELSARLFERPYARARNEIDRTEELLAELADRIDRRDASADLLNRVASMRAELQDAEVEAESSQVVQDSLKAQLDSGQERRNDARERLNATRQEVDLLQVRIAEATGLTQTPEISSRLVDLTTRLTSGMAQLDALEHSVIGTDERVARLAAALDEARAMSDRSSSRRAALQSQLEALESQLLDASGTGTSVELDYRFESLVRQRDRLTAILSDLQPVELEIWR